MTGWCYLPLSYTPIIPSRIKPMFPTFTDHFLHLRLQILSNTPNTCIRDVLLRINEHFNVIVAIILIVGIFLDGCKSFNWSNFPVKSITAGLRHNHFPLNLALFLLLFSLMSQSPPNIIKLTNLINNISTQLPFSINFQPIK